MHAPGSVFADAVSGKRVAIAGVLSPAVDSEAVAQSLRELVERNGGTVHCVVLQRRGVSRATTAGGAAAARRAAPLSSATFLGAGKAMELARLCRAQSVDVVVFSNALSRAQSDRLARWWSARSSWRLKTHSGEVRPDAGEAEVRDFVAGRR